MATVTITAKHCIITDECRANRGDNGAIEEALERIANEFVACKDAWPKGTRFHIKLEIEGERA